MNIHQPVISGSLTVTGSSTFIGNLTIQSGSITLSSGSLLGTSSLAVNAYTASYALPLTQSLIVSGGLTVTGSLNVSGSITGSLFGTASNAVSASYALTSSYATTSSYVLPLIQTVTITGSVNITGSQTINGYTQFQPVTTNINSSLSASYIYVSGSTQDLYFTQNGNGYSNTTRLRWIESNLYTGLLSGGVISSTPGSTTFSISSGSAIIVSLNASTSSADPNPTIQYVKWNNLSAPLTYSGSAKITYVGIDNTGNIVQQTVPWGTNNVNQWDTSVEIGVVLHLSGSVSTGVYNAPQVSYGFTQRTDDFLRAFGPLKISGHTLQASGSTLGLTKTAGTAYNDGANYVNNPNHPSTVSDPAINTSKIYRYYVSGSTPIIDTGIANAGYTFIDPTLYNNNGVLTTVPGSGANKQWSIQRVFWIPNSPTNAFIVYYGNATYASSIDAQNAIQTEVFTEAPNTAQNGILIGYIIVRKDCANLSDGTTAYITQGGLFRSINGIGNSNTPSISNTLAGLSDVAISGPIAGDLLVYGSGTQWNNAKALTGSYSLTGSLYASAGFTGSLYGTSSWAQNASSSLTASYVLNAISSSYSLSGSYALTASYALNTTSASYASTASYVALAQTASYVLQSISSSYSTTASYYGGSVTSASYASSASYGNSTPTVGFGIGGSSVYYSNVNSSIVGTNNLFTLSTGSYTSGFFKYTVYSGSNSRSGEVIASWNNGNTQYADFSTPDNGSTTAVTMSVSIVSSQIQFNAQTNTSGWAIKSQLTLI
jgi:fibronectin-binding autotransporter adhesin